MRPRPGAVSAVLHGQTGPSPLVVGTRIHQAGRMRTGHRARAVAVVVGGLVGAIAGAIAAVNLVIFAGVESGYESSPADVYRHSTLLGIAVTIVLLAGPILGVLAARRRHPRG